MRIVKILALAALVVLAIVLRDDPVKARDCDVVSGDTGFLTSSAALSDGLLEGCDDNCYTVNCDTESAYYEAGCDAFCHGHPNPLTSGDITVSPNGPPYSWDAHCYCDDVPAGKPQPNATAASR